MDELKSIAIELINHYHVRVYDSITDNGLKRRLSVIAPWKSVFYTIAEEYNLQIINIFEQEFTNQGVFELNKQNKKELIEDFSNIYGDV